MASIESVETEPLNPANPWGALTSSSLTLSGLLLQVTPESQNSKRRQWDPSAVLWQFDDMDHSYDSSFHVYMDEKSYSIPRASEARICLLPLTYTAGDSYQAVPSSCHGLILVKKVKEGSHCTRVGTFKVYNWKAKALLGTGVSAETLVVIR